MNNARRQLMKNMMGGMTACAASPFLPPLNAFAYDVESEFQEITPQLIKSIDRGLAFLASQQQSDGSYGHSQFPKHAGVTSIAGLAFMAHGDLPDRGPYSQTVKKALDFVLRSSKPNGLLAADTSHGPMYGHGFATLFLGEIYGQTHDPRIREALLKAVRLIINSQNDEGGWRYQPVPDEADISVTICQVKALRSARNAGIKVPKKTIDRAVEYVRKCQNPDGGFRYMLHSGGGSAFPRSAAGVSTLWYAGINSDDEAVQSGLSYLMRHLPGETHNIPHYFYGQYYAAQAMFVAGGKHWKQWFPAIRQELLSRQDSTYGSWSGQAGTAYGTGMALIILQMPYRYLPIFQK